MNLDSQHSLLGYAFITLAERTDSLVVGTARKIQSLFYLPFPFNPYFPVIPIGYTFPPLTEWSECCPLIGGYSRSEAPFFQYIRNYIYNLSFLGCPACGWPCWNKYTVTEEASIDPILSN